MKSDLRIDAKSETKRITDFMRKTFQVQGIKNAVIGLSGGIDSATSFYLLRKVLEPQYIYIAHLYYFEPVLSILEQVLKESGIPESNIQVFSIKSCVDNVVKILGIEQNEENKVRIGNVASRTRMIFLFDMAKKNHALVCGTENKTENLLGYYTRFGDQASDIEPIEHLYKTQVYQLAGFLGVPEPVIKQEPTAGLWAGQTDEGEFGFTYEEADQVLELYFDKHISIEDIEETGFKKARFIINRAKANEFKKNTPYRI